MLSMIFARKRTKVLVTFFFNRQCQISFRLKRIKFATGRRKRDWLKICLTKTSTHVDDWAHYSMSKSKSLFKRSLRLIFGKIISPNLEGELLMILFRNTKTACEASGILFYVAFFKNDWARLSYTCYAILPGASDMLLQQIIKVGG